MLQQYITVTLYQQQAITQGVEMATKVGRKIGNIGEDWQDF